MLLHKILFISQLIISVTVCWLQFCSDITVWRTHFDWRVKLQHCCIIICFGYLHCMKGTKLLKKMSGSWNDSSSVGQKRTGHLSVSTVFSTVVSTWVGHTNNGTSPHLCCLRVSAFILVSIWNMCFTRRHPAREAGSRLSAFHLSREANGAVLGLEVSPDRESIVCYPCCRW